jgi:ABC-type branched-subunit amino acid transport system ATPase component
MTALIEARQLSAGYGTTPVVHDVSLDVHPGEVVGVLGPNGAGKTTTLLALAGELPVSSGTLLWHGDASALPLHRRARQGLTLVPAERAVFTRLTVRQNLRIGRNCDIQKACSLFPELMGLMSRRAGLLSGGEQQMLALGRALAQPTELLLADELSLGLAPQAARRLMRAIRAAADQGMGTLIVEQQVHQLLRIADRVYVLGRGHVVFAGTAAQALARLPEIQAHYLTSDSKREPGEPGSHSTGGPK